MSKREAPPVVGGSSLLIIFAVLCLTIFAMLSLSTVQADRRMAESSLDASRGYYIADTEAEAILAGIRRGEVPQGVTKEGDIYRYQCVVSPVQELKVEVQVTDKSYRILCWELVSTTEWEAEEDLNLWDGSLED